MRHDTVVVGEIVRTVKPALIEKTNPAMECYTRAEYHLAIQNYIALILT